MKVYPFKAPFHIALIHCFKALNRNCSRRHFIFIFYFYLLKKIMLEILRKSSAYQRIYMKYQVLFSLKNNEKKKKSINKCYLLHF